MVLDTSPKFLFKKQVSTRRQHCFFFYQQNTSAETKERLILRCKKAWPLFFFLRIFVLFHCSTFHFFFFFFCVFLSFSISQTKWLKKKNQTPHSFSPVFFGGVRKGLPFGWFSFYTYRYTVPTSFRTFRRLAISRTPTHGATRVLSDPWCRWQNRHQKWRWRCGRVWWVAGGRVSVFFWGGEDEDEVFMWTKIR